MDSEQQMNSTPTWTLSTSTSDHQNSDQSIKSISLEDYNFEESGYDYLDEINENLICPICTNPFVDPVMCESTDHVFCRLCLIKSLELSSTCPIDRLPLSISIIQPAPKIIIKLVDELIVTCPFKDKFQCSFLSQRYLMKTHTDSHVCEMAFNSKDHKKPIESDLSYFELNQEDHGFQFEWNQGKIQRVLIPTLDFPARSEQDQFYKKSYSSTSSSPLSSSPSLSSTSSPRTRSITSNSSDSISTVGSTPPNESNLLSCPYQKFGCKYTCQDSNKIQTVHLSSSSSTKRPCEFKPIEEILESFHQLEQENQKLKNQCKLNEIREHEFKRMIESCNLSLRELWEKSKKSISSGSEGFQIRRSSDSQVDQLPNHMRYDPIHGNRIQSNPNQLNLNHEILPSHYHQHFQALWNRNRELEIELIRSNDLSLHLHELVKNLTRLQIQTNSTTSDSNESNENRVKDEMKMLKKNQFDRNGSSKNLSNRSYIKL
ncbi:hypothetical protein DFH28DRAFT_969753 [Melampsora americana]|nr:hypothetical protein DFH28DRAFT_969753 [Melampsora americana]